VFSFSTSKIADKPIFKLTGSNFIFKGFVFKDISFSKSIVNLMVRKKCAVYKCQFLKYSGEGREAVVILNVPRI